MSKTVFLQVGGAPIKDFGSPELLTLTHMAANQKHWVCDRLGRTFRDVGL